MCDCCNQYRERQEAEAAVEPDVKAALVELCKQSRCTLACHVTTCDCGTAGSDTRVDLRDVLSIVKDGKPASSKYDDRVALRAWWGNQ